MSSNIFERLLQNSRSLVDSPTQTEGPRLQRDLGQVRSESDLLKSRVTNNKDQGLANSAHYFLAQGGINTQEISENLDSVDTGATFQRSETIPANDVESYLKQVQKDMVLATIAESDRNTREKVIDILDEDMFTNSRNTRRKFLEDWHDEQEDLKFGRKGKDQQVQSLKQQVNELSNVVKEVNKNRLLSSRIPIIKEFKSLAKYSQCDKAQERSMLESWDFAFNLTNESNGNALLFTTENTIKRNQVLIKSAKIWLENTFMSYINDTLHKNAVEARVGGAPSVKHRIQVFMKTVYLKQLNWAEDRLEIHNDIPVWLYIYLLIRSGNHKLALDFVEQNSIAFVETPSFSIYLKEYFSMPENIVSEDHRKEILEDYQKMFYGNVEVDPYKVLLYKIIGRCELDNKTTPEVIKTVEDYMWLELSLIRERHNLERYQYEHYRLSHFQKKISDAGANHFDPHGTNPWYYFKILLWSLQFEKAIDHLYKSEKFRVEAVHFGIAFAYHQLLSNPKNPRGTTDLLVTEVDGSVSLNFARLISQFVRLFVSNAHDDALQYLYLMTLYPTEDMKYLCREKIVEYIVRCKEYKEIIGYIDQTKGRIQEGRIEKYKSLIGIERYDLEAYRDTILYPIAQKFECAGKYRDAVSIYEFAGKYSDALKVLNRQLDYALKRNGDSQNEHSKDQSLIEFSYSLLRRFETTTYVKCDAAVLNTHKALLKLLEATLQFEQKQYEQAVQTIKSTYLLPEINEVESVMSSATKFNKETDFSIRKHISEILLMVMESYHELSKSYSKYNPNLYGAYQNNISNIKNKALALLSFVVLIDVKIPGVIIQKLNKISSQI